MKGDYLAEQGVLLSHLFPLKINNRLRFVLKLPLKLLDSSSFGLDLLPQAILLGLVLSLGAQQFLALDLELSLELADPGLKSKDFFGQKLGPALFLLEFSQFLVAEGELCLQTADLHLIALDGVLQFEVLLLVFAKPVTFLIGPESLDYQLLVLEDQILVFGFDVDTLLFDLAVLV